MEAKKPELTSKGISDVDAVITTRELIRMIRMYGIDMNTIEPENADYFYSAASTNGKLVNVTGGKAEAIVRGLYYAICGTDIPENKISALRGSKNIKEVSIKMGSYTIGVAVVNGLTHAPALLNELLAGRNDLHYVEVMACAGGCVAGGGQPVQCKDESVKLRTKSIYDYDDKEIVRAAYLSPQIEQVYKEFLTKPFDTKNLNLLHGWFGKKEILF
jgi:iron only hydrogenase large subunit-like protein